MKKRANPDSEANIRRIDSKPKAKKQTHGFQVHFLRGDQAVTRMFSDAIHGGKENARRAARKFRKSAMGDLPERIFRGPAGADEGAARKTKGRTSSAKSSRSSTATSKRAGAKTPARKSAKTKSRR